MTDMDKALEEVKKILRNSCSKGDYSQESYLADLGPEKDFDTRQRAVLGLDAVGDRSVFPELGKIIDNADEDIELRELAKEAIESIIRREKRKEEGAKDK